MNKTMSVPTTGELRDRSHDGGCDARYTAEWTEASEGKTWDLPCYLIRRGEHVIMWSCTDEAGVADVTVAAAEDDIDEQVREFAEDLADDLAL